MVICAPDNVIELDEIKNRTHQLRLILLIYQIINLLLIRTQMGNFVVFFFSTEMEYRI